MHPDHERTLPVAHVAAVLAALRHYGPANTAEVLARYGVDASTWQASLAAAAGTVAGEDDPRGPAGTAFADAFRETMARLGAARAPLSALGPLPDEERSVETDDVDDPTLPWSAALTPLPEAPREPLGPQPEDRWARWRGAILDERTVEMVVVRAALPFVPAPGPRDDRVSEFEVDDETRLGTVADLGEVLR